ncbi:insulinase family protein [Psychrosphaera sp. B3R10]|uniref:M16 family metallopeptidase n=1 Tax=unclassified Psychrosphaera TaxID=2641570 RepID=UPI001C09D0CE|nr:insulinase family protein [Psychrosphaera sp. I2R16]MBU2989231.1 insulinase family protein [Psychrosphaera sp. B3R10]
MISIKQIFSVVVLAATVAACTDPESSGSVQIESAKQSKSLSIEKYQLKNGLDVVLHQDKSDPVVAVAIVYHVGSNRELPGKTGFAHFFEHMLFQNSENVGAGNFINNIGSMGGTLNGGTWQDGTIYYEVVPNDGLEQILWMESDRMGYFINTVTQEGLENEKQVVKNEKRQSIDNRPYGHTDSVVMEAIYPKGHPYSWSVIGSLEDLQNSTLQDVRDFYQKWYGVNNATLVLAGDFESEQTKAWIEKYFGELLPQPEVSALPPMPAKLDKNVSLFHEDNFAQLPELTLTFPIIEQYHPDAYALELLADVLNDGKDSVFYQTLVEQDKLAPSIHLSAYIGEIAGTFSISARAFDGTKLDNVKASIDKAVARFSKEGFNDEQLARIITRKEKAFYNNLTSVFNKASSLAIYNEFAGDPNLITTEIERYKNVTRKDIMNVFNKYIKGQHYVATSFVPKGQTELVLSGAIKANVVEEKVVQGAETTAVDKPETELTPLVQATSAFDRSVRPEFGKKPTITLPDVWNATLDNGIQVLGIEHNELPLVSFSIRIMGGHAFDTKGKVGTANLVTSMMMEGTANKTPQQLEKALGELGADIQFTTSDEYLTLTGNTLAANFTEVMSLAQEILLQPRWDEAEWDRIKKETIAQIQQSKGSPGAISNNVYNKLMYSADNMLSTPILGTTDDLNNIDLQDLKAFYASNIVANLTSVHVAGDVTQQQVKASLGALSKGLTVKDVTMPPAKAATPIDKAQLYFVDVPGAKQSFIRIGSRAMVANADDYYPLVAVNHNLGGSFSGQLFQILRLQKGYTYGAYSSVNRRNLGGVFTASSSVRSNVTLESLQTFREIMADYVAAFDANALKETKSVLSRSSARAFETTNSLMGVLQNISSYQLPKDYVAKQQATLANLTLEQAQQTLANYINPGKMLYLVVGDAETQLERVKELGLGDPIVLDTSGNPVN